MILKKLPSSSLVTPPSFPPTPKPSKYPQLLGEVRRLAILAAATGLMLSLVSYSPEDFSLTTWSSEATISNWMGVIGSITADIFLQGLGLGAFSIVVLLYLLALKPNRFFDDQTPRWALVGPPLFVWATTTLCQVSLSPAWTPWKLDSPGGLVGQLSVRALEASVGHVGAPLITLLLLAISIIIVFEWLALASIAQWAPSLGQILKKLFFSGVHWCSFQVKKGWEKIRHEYLFRKEAIPCAAPQEEPRLSEECTVSNPSEEGCLQVAPVQYLKQKSETPLPRSAPQNGYQLPPLTLLKDKGKQSKTSTPKDWYIEKGKILVEKLRDFGVEGEIINICPGPVITVYEFKPASGVKIREIANLSDDLTLALSVLSVRIVAPIPGKPVVGIEIPTLQPDLVLFKDLLQETAFFKGGLKVPILLGRLASGEPVASDLFAMPHLLVAGATGTGKSVFINTLILSLLYRFTPKELRLILVDPKMVELSHYDQIPHLLLPVVMESRKAAAALRWLVEEMERRYLLMHQLGVRHLDDYNEKIQKMPKTALSEEDPTPLEPLPYIVVVIDEYADLMATVPKEVELSISRLAQKARASGIHLVLATQRPSTDVVTGTIKSNFPSRISFRVASAIDSRTILDRAGAERLLGQGDMLFYSAGFTSLKRMQGAYVSDEEIERVVDFLRRQGPTDFDESLLLAQAVDETESPTLSEGADGELYDRAVRVVADKGEASISLVQRHLKIGYNRAASLIEEMEKNGVVGPASGPTKRRSVLISP